MSYVIFTIDFENNPLRMNVFLNHIAALPRGEMQGEIIPMLGCYKGQKEHSFICNAQDFDIHIRGTEFIKGQESILHVASGNKMEAYLEYLADGRTEQLGCMHQVPREEALQSEAYTYRPDMNCYWVAKQGNPDGSYAESVARYRMPATDEQLAVAAE
jgi:hypothetical protein